MRRILYISTETYCNKTRRTISILAKQRISILESGSLPSILRKIIRQELEHHVLFLVTGSLTPETVNHFFLAEREKDEGPRGGIAIFLAHECVSSYYL